MNEASGPWQPDIVRTWLDRRVAAARLDQAAADRRGREQLAQARRRRVAQAQRDLVAVRRSERDLDVAALQAADRGNGIVGHRGLRGEGSRGVYAAPRKTASCARLNPALEAPTIDA